MLLVFVFWGWVSGVHQEKTGRPGGTVCVYVCVLMLCLLCNNYTCYIHTYTVQNSVNRILLLSLYGSVCWKSWRDLGGILCCKNWCKSCLMSTKRQTAVDTVKLTSTAHSSDELFHDHTFSSSSYTIIYFSRTKNFLSLRFIIIIAMCIIWNGKFVSTYNYTKSKVIVERGKNSLIVQIK